MINLDRINIIQFKNMNKEIAQIFFPLQNITKEGYLIGFNIRGLTFSIIFIDSAHDVS